MAYHPLSAWEPVVYCGGRARKVLPDRRRTDALVAFSRFTNNLDGQVFVFFIITVAAAEVSVGLALIVALCRKRQTAHIEDLRTLKL